jgi:hypothetical protein
MNNLDARLRRSMAAPRRPLHANFTTQTLAKLESETTEPKYRPKWKEFIPVKLFSKPLFAASAAVAVVALGGSAYAAVGGISGIRALFAGETQLHNGARIVKVATENCPHINAFNITNKNRTPHDPVYYRIKPGSKLTNQQVVDTVQGSCEADAEGVNNGTIARAVAEQPENKNKLVGGYADSTISALSKDSITLTFDMPYGTPENVYTLRHIVQTFNHIDPAVTVIYNGTTIPFETLKIGDHVAISYRATGDALAHSETMPQDKLDTNQAAVVIITKLSKHMQDYFTYTKYNGKEFEQVAPCDKDPSGYCDAATYLDQK